VIASTLPSEVAPWIAPCGWALDDFEFVEAGRGRALFRSPLHRLFVRLDGPGREARGAMEVEFATWAAAAGLPVVAPDARAPSQPVLGGFGAVTFWPLHEPVPLDEVDLAWFGRTLRRLHDQRPLPPVRRWDPRSSIAAGVARLRAIAGLDPGLAAALATAGDRAAARAEAAASRAAVSPIHGDASPDNVVRDGDRLLLTDFEQGTIGPAGYDLAPVRMLARRFGLEPERRDEVLLAYGIRPDVEGDDALTELYEVVVTAGAIARHAAHPVFERELRHRLGSLERPGAGDRWTPHRHLLATLPGA
jgi:aminoglycoside phosphotransferase (APT) family kinase protein